MITALWLLAAQGVLGAFDTVRGAFDFEGSVFHLDRNSESGFQQAYVLVMRAEERFNSPA